MRTLDDAWRWYQAVAEGMKRLTHLAKFWGEFPWEQSDEWVARVKQNNVLRHVEAVQMSAEAKVVSDEHDDLAVLVLFSVFEAVVRDRLRSQLEPEISRLKHPSLVRAGKEVEETIAHGSFGKLLQAFKLNEQEKNLVEQVNQIRAWRNWVAHGRRAEMRPATEVRPRDAYERLNEFLQLIQNFTPADSTPPVTQP
ncbi:hypothetical protein R5W23_004039 [Gemmata sp. JC673]|uniref:RiboL-PSP-HEPN domain-containing protein n=1 Tax=Gemmata algarum TaxID=2975278 RepID=A0ABU5F882_9BACT|nr:hypothetical protein [Gemmata algarum]MDY3562573.1 hypothetical protein [Gemmata algarum]